MEKDKTVNIGKTLSSKKIYLNENDNTSTDITERLNDSKKNPQEKLIGNYNIETIIDKSPTNKVVLAKHIITEEKVAIKILNKKSFIKDILNSKRIKKEIQILKMIKHENIIKLLEIIENKNKIYLITDYYPNKLLSLIIKNKKLPEETALYYFNQFINGLYYLNQNGICHRNIRPDNLLLDEDNKKIKIIDFGLSTTYSRNQLLNSLVGEIIYAPPEMHLSEKYSGELIDIWKAGLVLYIMVCGHLPFCDEDEEKNINHIITVFYEIPSDISSNCAYIIRSCLQVDPNKRINFEGLHKYFDYTKGLIIDKNIIPLDDKIIEECKKYLGNINNQDIIEQIKESVKNNKFNEFNALYYLVMKKMINNGYESISDLSSELFKKYIGCGGDQVKKLNYYEKTKITDYSYFNKKSNNKYNPLNKSHNSISYIKNPNKKYSSDLPSYKKQFIFSPVLIKSINSNRSSSNGRNESKIRSQVNSNKTHSNGSYKNILVNNPNIRLDDNSYNNKVDCFNSISPKVIFNKKNFFFDRKKYYVKKNLLGSYSSWKNARLNSELINRCNSCENNLTDSTYNNYNNINTNYIHLYENTIMPSMRIDEKKMHNIFSSSIENVKNSYRSKNSEKNKKAMEIIKKIKETKICENKCYNDKKYKLTLEKNNINIDENDDSINILTEDKPIENFNISISNNNCNCNKSNNNIMMSKNHNDYFFKRNSILNNGYFTNKLKAKKNNILRGRTTIFKSGFKLKKILEKKEDEMRKINGYIGDKNNLSNKNSFRPSKNNNKIKGVLNICKNINKGYNSNISHNKNNLALLMTLFDHKNKSAKDFLKDYNKNNDKDKEDKDTKKRIKGFNNDSNKNEKFKNINKNLETYESGSYNAGVFDLSCLKIESINSIKEKMNKVLKNKKVNFSKIKNNKYRCSKLGFFFDVDILEFENFLSLNNNKFHKNSEKDYLYTKKSNDNKKIMCYLSFHIKNNNVKKNINSIAKDFLI